MSLKSLIQRLLDSRTTPEQAGHSAMPTTPEITSQSFAGPFGSWGPVASGTASEDGYIYAAGAVATPGSNSEFRLDNGQFGSYITSTWGNQGLLLPVMKGQSWRLYATNRKDVVIRLYRLVGGGYNFFVRRALLCLRALSNYLPKVFLRAKNSGLAVKHSLKQLLHWMFRHVPSLHRLMGILDTSTLSAVEANSCSIWIRVKKYLAVKSLVIAGFLQQTPTARQQYLSRKAVLLLLLPTRCSVKFGLLRLQARHNLLFTGGALC